MTSSAVERERWHEVWTKSFCCESTAHTFLHKSTRFTVVALLQSIDGSACRWLEKLFQWRRWRVARRWTWFCVLWFCLSELFSFTWRLCVCRRRRAACFRDAALPRPIVASNFELAAHSSNRTNEQQRRIWNVSHTGDTKLQCQSRRSHKRLMTTFFFFFVNAHSSSCSTFCRIALRISALAWRRNRKNRRRLLQTQQPLQAKTLFITIMNWWMYAMQSLTDVRALKKKTTIAN